jgi:hypothetical protein
MHTRTTIVIGGAPDRPVVTRLPDRLVGARGTEFVWEVENNSGAVQEISLERFTDQSGAKHDPLDKRDPERRARPDKVDVIRDRVRQNAAAGVYKYEIWLNGALAVDPEVEIKEET